MMREKRAQVLGEQLVGEFLKNGNFDAVKGGFDVESLLEVVPAATNFGGPRLSDYGFAGLSVQSVGYSLGSDEEIVHIYVTRGSQQALKQLSGDIDGVQIQVTNLGKLVIRPESIALVSNGGQFYEHNGRVACGSSCAPAGQSYTGTFGALVESNGSLMALSNNHVFAACNHVPVGQPILSPSPADAYPGIPGPREFCRHADIIELRSGTPPLVPLATCDAAIAAISDSQMVTSWQGGSIQGYDTPTRITAPSRGLRVKKVGRTTGLTVGTVQSFVEWPWALPYKNTNFTALVWFKEVWTVVADDGEMFGLPGDSGSLIVTEEGDAAVGLLFASSNKGTHAYFAPIETVLNQLNVSLVGNHGL